MCDFVLQYVVEQIKSNKANEAQHVYPHLLSTALDILALSRKLEKANRARYVQNRTLFPCGCVA